MLKKRDANHLLLLIAHSIVREPIVRRICSAAATFACPSWRSDDLLAALTVMPKGFSTMQLYALFSSGTEAVVVEGVRGAHIGSVGSLALMRSSTEAYIAGRVAAEALDAVGELLGAGSEVVPRRKVIWKLSYTL